MKKNKIIFYFTDLQPITNREKAGKK